MVRWKLKQVLIEKKLSMRDAAKLTGVSYSRIRKLCLHPTRDAKVHTLGKLADALDVTYNQLIESEHLQ